MKTKIEERNEKFYTKEGLKAMQTRLKNWMDLYNNYDFPVKEMMLGFGKFTINSKEECLNRIKELSELIGYPLKMKKELIVDSKERKIKEEIIDG